MSAPPIAKLSDKPITKAQIKQIHVQLHRLGIDDATYRALLDELWGVATCKDLTRRQASALLNRLGVRLTNAPGQRPGQTARKRKKNRPAPRHAPLPEGVVQLASPEQQRFVRELATEVDWRLAGGFERWLEHNMGLPRVRTHAEAQKVIEGLKAMKRRQADAD